MSDPGPARAAEPLGRFAIGAFAEGEAANTVQQLAEKVGGVSRFDLPLKACRPKRLKVLALRISRKQA
jgi:hypothetical protein